MQIAGTRVMLLVELDRARHSRYPDTLDALIPEVAESLPVDPLTGRPFGYRPLASGEDQEVHSGYLLYSWGADGKDDSGRRLFKRNHAAFNRLTGQGYDYVFNFPRAQPEEEPPPEPP
jgi:hypothetical protein